MIEQIKKQLDREGFSPKSIVAMIVFGAIVLVFVLFGFQGRHNAIGVGAAARVNQSLISVADFRNESQRIEQMYAQFLGSSGNANAQRQFIQSQALENLITSELIYQGSSDQGLKVSDSEVRDYIVQDMQAFKKDGKFQKDLYRQLLEANRFTPAEFEEKIRRDIQNQRARRLFELSSVNLKLETEKMNLLKQSKMNVAFIKIEEEKAAQSFQVKDDELKTRLSDPQFVKKAEADFNMNKSLYSESEKVRAAHILIKVKQGDSASEQVALKKIQDLKTRAQKEDFSSLAVQFSEDIGSKKNKGDLGYFERGKMVPEFEAVAFDLKIGVVSEPIKTPFGYHLIKVLDHKSAVDPNFENLKETIAKKMIAIEKQDAQLKKIEEALKDGQVGTLDQLVKESGLQWAETGFTSIDSDSLPVLGSRVATQAAFSLSEKEPVLKHLVMDGGTKFILKLKGVKKDPMPSDNNLALNQEQQMRSNELFMGWIDNLRKKSTVEKNQSLIRE